MNFAGQLKELVKTSYVTWAFIAFIACDLFCHVAWPSLKLDHFASPHHSMVWWNIDDFRKQKENPDIVLIGSSLLMHALHGGDAEYLQVPQNEVFHHKSVMLENLLKEKTGAHVKTFAFPLAGQMASDAYALTSTLLTGNRTPKAIVYTIAPRDFMDNTLAHPASTEIFKFMNHLGGVQDVAWDARPGFLDKVEYGLEKLSAIYDHRQYLVYLQHKYAQSVLRLMGFKNPDEIHTPFELRRLALLDLPESTGVNERFAGPNLKYAYTDNTAEYCMRYQPFKEKPFRTQVEYLERFLGYCKQKGIQVVLVNMPLLEQNIQLLPPGSYDLYKSNVQQLATKYDARFLDMQDSTTFTKEMYCDSAHMNGPGGMKFFSLLSDKLANDTKLAIGKKNTWQ